MANEKIKQVMRMHLASGPVLLFYLCVWMHQEKEKKRTTLSNWSCVWTRASAPRAERVTDRCSDQSPERGFVTKGVTIGSGSWCLSFSTASTTAECSQVSILWLAKKAYRIPHPPSSWSNGWWAIELGKVHLLVKKMQIYEVHMFFYSQWSGTRTYGS
jgi:hypothetical protein